MEEAGMIRRAPPSAPQSGATSPAPGSPRSHASASAAPGGVAPWASVQATPDQLDAAWSQDTVHDQDDVESQIQSLDQKEMEIHQTTLRLMRKQVTALTGDMLVLQREVVRLRAAVEGCDAAQRSQSSVVGARLRDLREALDLERQDRNTSQGDFHTRIVSLERGLPASREEIDALRSQVAELHEYVQERVPSSRCVTEDFLAQERGERLRQQGDIHDKIEAVQRSVTNLDTLVREEAEERAAENRRIWHGLDNHTHDLETKVIEDLQVGGLPLPQALDDLAASGRTLAPKAALELPLRPQSGQAPPAPPAASFAWRPQAEGPPVLVRRASPSPLQGAAALPQPAPVLQPATVVPPPRLVTTPRG